MARFLWGFLQEATEDQRCRKETAQRVSREADSEPLKDDASEPSPSEEPPETCTRGESTAEEVAGVLGQEVDLHVQAQSGAVTPSEIEKGAEVPGEKREVAERKQEREISRDSEPVAASVHKEGAEGFRETSQASGENKDDTSNGEAQVLSVSMKIGVGDGSREETAVDGRQAPEASKGPGGYSTPQKVENTEGPGKEKECLEVSVKLEECATSGEDEKSKESNLVIDITEEKEEDAKVPGELEQVAASGEMGNDEEMENISKEEGDGCPQGDPKNEVASAETSPKECVTLSSVEKEPSLKEGKGSEERNSPSKERRLSEPRLVSKLKLLFVLRMRKQILRK